MLWLLPASSEGGAAVSSIVTAHMLCRDIIQKAAIATILSKAILSFASATEIYNNSFMKLKAIICCGIDCYMHILLFLYRQ